MLFCKSPLNSNSLHTVIQSIKSHFPFAIYENNFKVLTRSPEITGQYKPPSESTEHRELTYKYYQVANFNCFIY